MENKSKRKTIPFQKEFHQKADVEGMKTFDAEMCMRIRLNMDYID